MLQLVHSIYQQLLFLVSLELFLSLCVGLLEHFLLGTLVVQLVLTSLELLFQSALLVFEAGHQNLFLLEFVLFHQSPLLALE